MREMKDEEMARVAKNKSKSQHRTPQSIKSKNQPVLEPSIHYKGAETTKKVDNPKHKSVVRAPINHFGQDEFRFASSNSNNDQFQVEPKELKLPLIYESR